MIFCLGFFLLFCVKIDQTYLPSLQDLVLVLELNEVTDIAWSSDHGFQRLYTFVPLDDLSQFKDILSLGILVLGLFKKSGLADRYDLIRSQPRIFLILGCLLIRSFEVGEMLRLGDLRLYQARAFILFAGLSS